MRPAGQRPAEHDTLIAPVPVKQKPSSVSCSCQASGRRECTSSLSNIDEVVDLMNADGAQAKPSAVR